MEKLYILSNGEDLNIIKNPVLAKATALRMQNVNGYIVDPSILDFDRILAASPSFGMVDGEAFGMEDLG